MIIILQQPYNISLDQHKLTCFAQVQYISKCLIVYNQKKICVIQLISHIFTSSTQKKGSQVPNSSYDLIISQQRGQRSKLNKFYEGTDKTCICAHKGNHAPWQASGLTLVLFPGLPQQKPNYSLKLFLLPLLQKTQLEQCHRSAFCLQYDVVVSHCSPVS